MKSFINFLCYLIILSGIFCISSCQDELVSESTSPKNQAGVEISKNDLKKKFGVALAKVLAESSSAREFIKNEALKQFDCDYDVLYLLVKDNELSDNSTLEECLLKYIDKNLLFIIENEIPTLTIFVPELPENSFSAKLWNTEKEYPSVAIGDNGTGDVTAFDPKGCEFQIKARDIPGFPIVVVKENERIVVNDEPFKSECGRTILLNTKSGMNASLAFLDDVFDNYNKVITKGGREDHPIIPPGAVKYTDAQIAKTLEAFKIWGNSNGWQRDYVYYGIKSENGEGPFDNDYEEHLIGFEMVGKPMDAYNDVIDQDDPHYTSAIRTYGWTKGNLTFKFKVEYGSTTAAGSEVVKYLDMSPSEIFQLRITHGTGGGSSSTLTYHLDGMTLKMANVYLPLFRWKLEEYSPTVRITVEEKDLDQVTKTSKSETTTFAANFEYSAGFGEVVKQGAKFGVNGSTSKTVTYDLTTTLGNDELGQVVASFGDEIITEIQTEQISRPLSTITTPIFNKRYSTGLCRLYIAPLKVQ